jgi:DNA-directed RNA polymerase specialized sigma24 family protein
MVVRTGDGEADTLLSALGPLLPALLAELTPRQREVGRLVLVDHLRLADTAERLRVSRATVSVIADRGRVRHLGRLAASLATLFRDGCVRVAGSAVAAGSTARAGSAV